MASLTEPYRVSGRKCWANPGSATLDCLPCYNGTAAISMLVACCNVHLGMSQAQTINLCMWKDRGYQLSRLTQEVRRRTLSQALKFDLTNTAQRVPMNLVPHCPYRIQIPVFSHHNPLITDVSPTIFLVLMESSTAALFPRPFIHAIVLNSQTPAGHQRQNHFEL